MAHVFVSYDRDDRDFAEVVQAKLERAGHKTSLDLDILRAGDDWQDKLDSAIRGSDALVVIMSPEARASDYVAYEWAFSLGAGVTVIPLQLRSTPFPPRLDGLHRLDFTAKNRPWDTLLAEVARAEAGRRAAHVAGDPDTPPAVQQARRAIDSLVPEERRAAIETLAQADHPTALATLTRALEHPVRDVRAAAASVFPDRRNPRIVRGLIDGYRIRLESWLASGRAGDSPDPVPLFETVAMLGASATSALTDALNQLDAEPGAHDMLRETLVEAIGRTKDPAALPVLENALTTGTALTRSVAAQALGALEAPAGAAALRAALTDPDENVRHEAARSAGRLKDAGAVPALVDCLGNDTANVRARAAEALGHIAAAEALPALTAALQDNAYAVKKAAADALGRLGDASAVAHLTPLLPRNNNGQLTDLDMSVMTALVRLRDADSLEHIGDLLVDFRSGKYGGEVYEELARYGEHGIRILVRILTSERRNATQSEAARALESIHRPDVLSALKSWRRKHQ